MRVFLLLVVVLVAYASGCNLSDPVSLSKCLKDVLNDARPEVKKRADPLHLKDKKAGDFNIRNVVITGLSQYNIENLQVAFPIPGRVRVIASLSWPSIRGNLLLVYRRCFKLFGRQRCVEASAKPDVTVGKSGGALSTTLVINISGGKIGVVPQGTKVNLHLSNISVKPNLQGGLGGLIGRIFGGDDTVNLITSFIANEWWKQGKKDIEGEAAKALDDVIRKHAAFELAKLLQG